MMENFQGLMLVVAAIAALGSVADKEKSKFIALFAVAGVLFLASLVIQSII